MKDTVDNPFKNADMIKHKSSSHQSKGPAYSGKLKPLLLESIPVILMILLLFLPTSEINRTGLYLAIIIVALLIKYEKKDLILILSGIIASTLIFEILIFTKVVQFVPGNLINLPVWLPVIFAYGFITIKRCSKILEE